VDRTQQVIDCLQRWDDEDQAGRRASASNVCGDRTDLIPEVAALSEIRVSVELNRPAYVYIVWIDTEGTVSPQYPWIDHDWGRRDAEGKAAKFELPRFEGAWGAWTMGPGEPGLETMVLLCRDEPLPESVDLAGMLRGLGKVPLDGQDANAVSWFENGKTVRGEKQRAPLAKAVEGGNSLERINREIHRRVRDHFEYTRTITYGNAGGK
jgi:hypothetical protein